MQKLLVVVVAAALLTPTLVAAAVPGVNLGWNNCATTSASENRVFACDDNNLTFNLVGSFKLATDMPDFVGVSAVVDFRLNDAGTPAWWGVGTGGCREGALGLGSVGAVGGCVNPYSGANAAGGFVIDPYPQGAPVPNWFRVRGDWVRDSPGPVTNNVLSTAFIIQINTSSSFDEGFGVCAGCATSACIVLNSLEVFGLNSPVVFTEAADVRQWATYQGGAVGVDVCPTGTPSKNRTWGQIKSLYR